MSGPVFIEGGHSLQGDVKPSGSKNSAIKIIIASILCSDDVVVDNVPRTSLVLNIIEIIEHLGVQVEWLSESRLNINGSTINSYIIPQDLGSKSRLCALLAGPLLYRFGRAIIPKQDKKLAKPLPMNRWMDTWKSLGINIDEDSTSYSLSAQEIRGNTINFKVSTHTGTDNALLTAVFALGETTILNAAEESEVDDLVAFINTIGGQAERYEPRKIRIIGKSVFKGGYFEIQPDKIEVAAFACAALVTKGNVTIKNIQSLHLTSFINFLTKIGAGYDLVKGELSVWFSGADLKPGRVSTAPSPGFLVDWMPYATLLFTQAHGESTVQDTIYTDKFGYVQDLNRMGASIKLVKPSSLGMPVIISDDSYDIQSLGEPSTVVKISGPARLRGVKLNAADAKFDASLIIAALCSEGKTELLGVSEMETYYDRFFEKLISLGARIYG
ncbi:UDP-N-acetylglucosamine 1-carboxyvinyltransferase [Patescibacteria group bacterium]|nr:UDP-N-acetylglucosamine 1-carboxyvinyltransferase [Patescibacteria group bacterium]